MKKMIYHTVSLFFLLTLITNAGEVRTWTSLDGNFKIEAELIGISENGTTVILQKQDKKRISVALDKLSKADQKYALAQKNIVVVPEKKTSDTVTGQVKGVSFSYSTFVDASGGDLCIIDYNSDNYLDIIVTSSPIQCFKNMGDH